MSDDEPMSLSDYVWQETPEPLDIEAVERGVEKWLRSYLDAGCSLSHVLEAFDV